MISHLSQPNQTINLSLDFIIDRKLLSGEILEIPWSFPYSFEMEPVITKEGKKSWQSVPSKNEEDITNEQYFGKWLSEKAHTSRFLTDWEAIGIFREEIYSLCMSKIAGGEQIQDFTELLKKSRSENKIDIQRAKAFPMEELLRRYGYEPRMGSVNCPFHDDSSPSLSIHKKTNRWKCFGCNAGGDTIDLVMKKQNVSFVEAVNFLI